MTYDLTQLTSLGIEYDDAVALRRISMTLQRWYELECGNGIGAIEREGDDGEGRPFWRYGYFQAGEYVTRAYPISDRERGAKRRLARIMAKYPTLESYIQGDPRGCALYILRPGDVPEGEKAESYYNRGVAVYK